MTKIKKIIGLTNTEAIKALKHYGFNELKKEKKFTAIKVLLRQFINAIVWILMIAAVISYGIGETINFWVINFIIAFAVIMGFIQEYKAERAMEALKDIILPATTVIRDGLLMTIPAREVVPGDLLSLEIGDNIPADAELNYVVSLEVDESTLTGESITVHKSKGDYIYAGTKIVNGRCTARATKTGMRTKLGNIATLIQEEEEATPLQKRMDQLSRLLAYIALSASVMILIIGILKGTPIPDMLIVALALAVAAVPVGLPLTMTLALSFGMHKMASKKAIVRRMMAVETLGSTSVICTDKTGTLTENEMTVEKIFLDGQAISVTGVGYQPLGAFQKNEKTIKPSSDWDHFFKAASLCNNANLLETEPGQWKPIGDPTEVALLTLTAKAGFQKEKLDEMFKRVEEIFFTPSRKMMSTIHRDGGDYFIYSKGAPEEILARCDSQLIHGRHKKLNPKDIETILKQNKRFAQDTLRVLALAIKTVKSKKIPSKEVEKNLTFLGLVAMRDPARLEVKEAIQTCQLAGIRVVMITGDNELTALSIAHQVGLVKNGKAPTLTGKEIETMTDPALSRMLKKISIFARTQPEHKLRIVQLLKKQGHIVAMTGDGVNDAPALKKADIGIAMGIKGTDVSKEASDMILQDDNFATIVEAVREGRRIYQNIEKFTTYLISRNFTEVILIFMGILFFDFHLLPLLAIQILFINAFDEEMPAVGLGLDQTYENLMIRKPRPLNETIMNKWNAFIVYSVAFFMAFSNFLIFLFQNPINNIEKARTMVFTTIVIMVMVGTFNFRSLRESALRTGILNNLFLVFSLLIIFIITIFIMYFPPTQQIFSLIPLNPTDWILCTSVGFASWIYMELIKLLRRRFEKPNFTHAS